MSAALILHKGLRGTSTSTSICLSRSPLFLASLAYCVFRLDPPSPKAMCYEPLGLWYVTLAFPLASSHISFLTLGRRVVELTNKAKTKTLMLDADTKITNIALNHEFSSTDGDPRSSIKLASNGHAGTICTLTPGKVSLSKPHTLSDAYSPHLNRPNRP